MPIQLALVDEDGKEVGGSAQVFQLKEAEADLIFENLPESPAFASMNRDYSFYGTFQVKNATRKPSSTRFAWTPTPSTASKPCGSSRTSSASGFWKTLMQPSMPEWLSVYGEILGDERLPRVLKAFFLRIDEQPLDAGTAPGTRNWWSHGRN